MLYMDFVIRILLCLLLGFLIGLERQFTGHPAGIRINCNGNYCCGCFDSIKSVALPACKKSQSYHHRR